MKPVIIIHDDEGDCTLPLLSKVAALARMPSISEVFDVLPDLNLEGQCKGLLSLVTQQPALQVALGRLMGLLDHVVNTERRLKSALEAKQQSESLLGEEQAQVALLLEANASLQTSLQWQQALVANASVCMQQISSERDAAVSEVATCKETIRALEEQLEAKAAVESMAPPYMDLDFLDEMDDDSSSVQSAATGDLITEFSSAREAKLQKEAEEKAAAAEAAPQQSASLEAKLQDEQEYSAWLLQRHKKAENAAAAAAEAASAEAHNCKQLQEQLQYKNASCASLVVALASEQVARTKAEQRAAECEQTAREHTILTAALALQRNRTMKVENLSRERDAAAAEVSSCKGTIRDLEKQLQGEAAESTALLPDSLDFLYEADESSSAQSASSASTGILSRELALSCAREAKLQNKAEESAAAAAAALQQKAYVEAELQDEQEYSAWLNQRHEQAQNAAAAAAEEAGAEAQHSTQLQEQLQDTKAGYTSLAVALSSEQVARMKAERQAAECQQRARDQAALMASLALQQNKAIQAGQRERQALRSRLRALQDERRETAGADASGIINSTPSTSPAGPAAASSGAGGVSAGGSLASSNKEPKGLLRAAITGAAIATALTEVSIKINIKAARCLWSSAASALAAAF